MSSPFSYLLYILKRSALRKASAVILMLSAAIVTMEVKGYGQSFFDRFKAHQTTTVQESAPQTPAEQQAQLPPQQADPQQVQPMEAQQAEQPQNEQTPYARPAHSTAIPPSTLEALKFNEGDFDWRQDWWKALLLVLGCLIAVTLLMRIARQLFRTIIMVACLAAGTGGARYIAPTLTPWFESKLPQAMTNLFPPLYWSYFLTFLCCYILATILLLILKRPLDIVDKRQKTKINGK